MIYIYLVISAALIPILNNFFDIFRESYSWWLVPLLFLAFFVGFIIIQLLTLVFMILFTNMEKSPDRGVKFFRFLIKHSLPVILWAARVKIHAEGTEKLPENTHLLFVCNHQHDFDPVIIISVFPDSDIGFVGKKEIYSTMPFIAKAMHRLYSQPIDRENDREAAKTIVKVIKTLREDKASIALFPEGYCSKTCELLPFRNGSLKTAMKAEVPIAVCVVNNTQSIPKRMFRRRTDIEFRLLDVIYPKDYEGLNTIQLGDRIHAQMLEALNEIRK